MNETMKKITQISAWLTIILFVSRCFIGQGDLIANSDNLMRCAYSIFGYAGEAIGVTVLLVILFNRFLWKWKPLNFILGKEPVLAKKYQGSIIYNYNNQKKAKKVEAEISQTFLNVKITLTSDESHSSAIVASIETVNNEKQLIYTYHNVPNSTVQDKSPIHYGTAILSIDNQANLTGNYYTGRCTRGQIKLKVVKTKH